jgi:hypothetical protein
MPGALPGGLIWEYYTPVLTVAASPLLGPWLATDMFSQIVPNFKFTGGTSVITLDASIDGSTLDADLTTLYGALSTGTALPVASPYIRVRVVQTIADNTVTKIFVKARA